MSLLQESLDALQNKHGKKEQPLWNKIKKKTAEGNEKMADFLPK